MSEFVQTAASKAYGAITSTYNYARSMARSQPAQRAWAVSRSVAQGAHFTGAGSIAMHAGGGVLGGLGGYTLSDRGDRVGGTLKGAGLGVLGVAAGKMGYSAYKNPMARAEAASLRKWGAGRYAMGRSNVVRRGANLMEYGRSDVQQTNYIRDYYQNLEGY